MIKKDLNLMDLFTFAVTFPTIFRRYTYYQIFYLCQVDGNKITCRVAVSTKKTAELRLFYWFCFNFSQREMVKFDGGFELEHLTML